MCLHTHILANPIGKQWYTRTMQNPEARDRLTANVADDQSFEYEAVTSSDKSEGSV